MLYISTIKGAQIMSSVENQIKEYDYLHNEISQKIELHNKLITFTITTVVAILSFALSKDNYLLYLMPFGIILPISMRIAYYRSAMVKLSAYMIVFLEDHIDGLKWESRNTPLINDHTCMASKSDKTYKVLNTLPNYECLVLSIVCYILYFVNYINGREFHVTTVINAAWPLIFILIECIITHLINSIDKQKTAWIKYWQMLKERKNE